MMLSAHSKINRLSAAVMVCFAVLLLNLARMQLWEGQRYRALSEKNRVRVIYLEAPRGKILDRNGEPLVTNRLSFNCSVIPSETAGGIRESCQILSGLLHEDAAKLEERFYKRRSGAFNTVLLAEDIPAAQAMAIEERLDSLPGFLIETRPQREYPYAEAAAHLTGFIGPLNREEAEAVDFYGYHPSDWAGRDGIEQFYESYLRGRSGGLQVEVDNRGRLVKALGVKEPGEGKDIRLTVDARLQSFIQGLFQSQKGSVIVMELEEGGILAINSAPSYNPNLFASLKGRKHVGKVLHDPSAPMLDRGIQAAYPPGSIYKIITASAALDRRKINEATAVHCSGRLWVGGKQFRCWNDTGHGPQMLTEAFAHSCNVYFYTAGLAAGLEAILQKSAAFGLAQRTGVDLPGEKKGFVPSREWKRRAFREAWYDGETLNLAIGQGYLQMTPIQALVMIAAVATNGEVLKPHVIEGIAGFKISERQARPLGLAPADLRAVKKGLDQVINSDSGTGRLARVPDLRVAGKTGTAQSGKDKSHAWFVGYAPAESPKVAVVVFLEHGGRGGVAAANVANAVFRWLKKSAYL